MQVIELFAGTVTGQEPSIVTLLSLMTTEVAGKSVSLVTLYVYVTGPGVITMDGANTSNMIGGVKTVTVTVFDEIVEESYIALAVAVFVIVPTSISCSVTTSVPVHVAVPPGARDAGLPLQSTGIWLSNTVKGPLSVTLPVFVRI